MKIIIEGVQPYDGEYQLDMERLTNRDLHTIKQLTGYTPDRFDEAGGDSDFLVAFAVIAVRKSLRFQKVDEDAFWDAEVGRITIDFEEDGEAVNPQSAPGTDTTPSGAPSPTVGDKEAVRSLRPTGTDSSGS